MKIRWKTLFMVVTLLFIGALSQNVYATEKGIVAEDGIRII